MHDLTDLYQSVILDHNRRPRNYSVLPTANRVGSGNNPMCGDQITVYVKLDGDRITDISFQGSGCAISQASASLMTVNLKGKTIAEAEAIYAGIHKLVTTGQVDEDNPSVSRPHQVRHARLARCAQCGERRRGARHHRENQRLTG
jgi:nitrogen fixation protein NifU and related proteins